MIFWEINDLPKKMEQWVRNGLIITNMFLLINLIFDYNIFFYLFTNTLNQCNLSNW